MRRIDVIAADRQARPGIRKLTSRERATKRRYGSRAVGVAPASLVVTCV